MDQPVTVYREFEPCAALRSHVRAFFSFAPAEIRPADRGVTLEVPFTQHDSFCSPLFADAHVSVLLSFDRTCSEKRGWAANSLAPLASVIGPTTTSAPTSPERREMVGAYLRAGRAAAFLNASAVELTDRTATLREIGGFGRELAAQLSEISSPSARIDAFEAALLAQVREDRRESIDVSGLAAWVLREGGRITVEQMADAAGVSRQQLTRVFRQTVGVTPKLYCRLARFRSTLAAVARPNHDGWAEIAVDNGYADQSHMIADFREFSSLTPHALATGGWFHPFIELCR